MNLLHQQEILEEILSRLPAKSIGRFRCVSKTWNSLLSQPQFIKTHLNRIKQFSGEQESVMLVSDDTQSLYSVKFDNAHQVFDEMTAAHATKLDFGDHKFGSETVYQHMCSCDGLVLAKDEDDKLLLINPTTRETKEVPGSPYALNPRHSFTMYGLGYDAITQDYKVVMLSYYNEYYYCDLESDEDDSDKEDTEMYVNVFSVKNGSWKKAKSSPYDHAVGHVTSGVFVDGYIHWLASETSGYSSVIVAFDLEQEDYYEVPPPSSLDNEKFVFNGLVELGGCLCMYSAAGVWVMKEYGVEESWTKLALNCKEYRPLCLLGNEQVVLVEDEDKVEKFVMYNMKRGTCKDIVVQGISPDFGFGGAFLESLVFPNRINEVTTER